MRTRADAHPGFIMIPSMKLKSADYLSEQEVTWVAVDDNPIPIEMIRYGGNGLDNEQLKAFARVNPAYPPNWINPEKTPGFHTRPLLYGTEKAKLQNNPRSTGIADNVQAILFDKRTYTKNQIRDWAKRHGLSFRRIERSSNYLRLVAHDAAAFAPGSFDTQKIGEGIRAIVGRRR